MAVIVPFESHATASIDQLVSLVAGDMERVNATILSRTGSEVTMIPEVANHLIFLHKGLVEEEGVPAQVLANPKSERLGQFLSGSLK